MDSSTEIFSEDEWELLFEELSLSPRQKDIVRSLFCGLSDKQIAMRLKIALPTVRTYFARLFSRFGVHDRNELVIYIFGHFRKRCSACKVCDKKLVDVVI